MLSRRSFIVAGITSAAALTLLGKAAGERVKTEKTMNCGPFKKGLVVWYSQTGNTERTGKLIAATWRNAGMQVDSGDYRDIDRSTLDKYDIIAAGTPVYYYEVPENFRDWINSAPVISGIPVASFVTFGGEGGNQHNTSCELLDLLVRRGGVPVAVSEFGSMSTYALTWSCGGSERVLRYSGKPDEATFNTVRLFAADILTKASAGIPAEIPGNFSLRNIIKGTPSIAATKLLITGHRVNRDKCVSCGRCIRACTVSAIDPGRGFVDTDKCIACLGCVNNCPAGAVEMNFMGNEVYGYIEFIKRNNIRIIYPEGI